MARIFTPNGWKWNVEQLYKTLLGLEGDIEALSDLNLISTLSDLPTPVGNIITLTGGNWFILDHIDLGGNRLLLEGINALIGFSSETSSITSTGLPNGQVMISGTDTTPIQNISITSPAGTQAVEFIGATGQEAIDWVAVNFVNCETVGLISNYSNFVMQDSAFLFSAGVTFDGAMGTIALESTFFNQPTGTLINLPATLNISRRFRIIYSSFVVTSGNVGIAASTSAGIPVEGYILDTVNFSGGGSYLTGVLPNDNKSLFSNCKGVNNSNTIADVRMGSNTTTTVVTTAGVAYKLAGNFLLNPVSQRFELVDNKLYYRGAVPKTFSISAIVTVSSGNNNEIGLYIGLNGVAIAQSEFYTTMNGNGRAENVACRAILTLQPDDYVDIHTENSEATANILGEYASLWVTPATN